MELIILDRRNGELFYKNHEFGGIRWRKFKLIELISFDSINIIPSYVGAYETS